MIEVVLNSDTCANITKVHITLPLLSSSPLALAFSFPVSFNNSHVVAHTLQNAGGATAAFREDPLANWLREHNKSDYQYSKAVDNFVLSCAGMFNSIIPANYNNTNTCTIVNSNGTL